MPLSAARIPFGFPVHRARVAFAYRGGAGCGVPADGGMFNVGVGDGLGCFARRGDARGYGVAACEVLGEPCGEGSGDAVIKATGISNSASITAPGRIYACLALRYEREVPVSDRRASRSNY